MITIYADVFKNPGPQSRNNIEDIIKSRPETKPRDWPCHYSNLVQVPLIAPAIVYNNRMWLMKCCVLNAQSLSDKGPVFVDYICDSEVDIAVTTETWLKSENVAIKIAASLTEYWLLDHPRSDRTGSGSGVLVRDLLVAKQARAGILNSFESSEWMITSGSFCLCLVAIYRPPY